MAQCLPNTIRPGFDSHNYKEEEEGREEGRWRGKVEEVKEEETEEEEKWRRRKKRRGGQQELKSGQDSTVYFYNKLNENTNTTKGSLKCRMGFYKVFSCVIGNDVKWYSNYEKYHIHKSQT